MAIRLGLIALFLARSNCFAWVTNFAPSLLVDTPRSTTTTTLFASSPNATSLEHRLKLSKAQSEIDRILQSNYAPFDAETELQKVTSVSQEETQDNDTKASTIQQLESDLYDAVRDNQFDVASQKRSQIDQLHMDEALQVLQVLSRFYRAFSKKQLTDMEQLWVPDESISCIHPSIAPIMGFKNVMKSWQSIFDKQNFVRNWMEGSNMRLSVRGGTSAVVVLDEDVYVRRFVRGQARKTERVNQLTTTFCFRKLNTKWYICSRHAGWHAQSETAQAALSAKHRLSRQKTTKRDSESVRMDGILGLGNVGPLLGNDDTTSSDASSENRHKQVVNFGDLIGGGLSDIIKNTAGSENTIIQFHRVEEEDSDDEIVEIIDQSDDSSTRVGGGRWRDGGDNDKSSSSSAAHNKDNKKSCIALVRRLSRNGSISPKQKRTLLTDIIGCSARKEQSLVEVAYDLLATDEEEDDFEEDFADQCRILADSLQEQNFLR